MWFFGIPQDRSQINLAVIRVPRRLQSDWFLFGSENFGEMKPFFRNMVFSKMFVFVLFGNNSSGHLLV